MIPQRGSVRGQNTNPGGPMIAEILAAPLVSEDLRISVPSLDESFGLKTPLSFEEAFRRGLGEGMETSEPRVQREMNARLVRLEQQIVKLESALDQKSAQIAQANRRLNKLEAAGKRRRVGFRP